jgi:hypothetical protein
MKMKMWFIHRYITTYTYSGRARFPNLFFAGFHNILSKHEIDCVFGMYEGEEMCTQCFDGST